MVEIVGDSASFEKALGSSSKAASGFEKGLKTASVGAVAAFAGIGVAAKIGWDEIAEGQKVAAQTGAVLKSTGGIANVSQKQVEGYAGALSELSGVDDEVIQSSENMLLTFTNVRNEVGKGNDIFKRATAAALDFSVATGRDATQSALMLGKALNDPVKGYSALSRAGVTFSDSQRKAIKTYTEAGNTLAAQKIILGEVTKEYGGSAKALGQTLPGQLNILKNSFAELAAQLTTALLPALTAGANVLATFAKFMSEHATATKVAIGAIAGLAAAVLAVNVGLKLYAAYQVAAAAATATWTAAQWLLNAALTANPIGIVVVALAALVGGLVLAYQHSEKFRAIVQGALKAVQVAAEAVLGFFRSQWKTIAVLISGPFAPLVLLATDAFGIRSALIGAFTAVKGWLSKNWPEIVTLISGPFIPIVALATDAFGVRSAMVRAFGAIKEAVVGTINAMIERFKWLRDNAGKIWQGFLAAITAPVQGAIDLFQRLASIIETVRGSVVNVLDQIANIKIPSLPGIPGIPGRQHGGPVSRGRAYVVGEAGPELFIPRSSGTIVAGAGGAAALAGMNVTLVFNGPTNPRESEDWVRRVLYDVGRRNPGTGL